MKYNTDRPIEKNEQDLLGRSTFSYNLGKAIYNYEGKDGLVIGLYGKWGTGKTSVVNMAINSLKRLAEIDGEEPIILSFSPWNYKDKDDLIGLFFKSLSLKINNQSDERLKRKVGERLVDYSVVLDSLPNLDLKQTVASKGASTFLKEVGKFLNKTPSLEETRRELEKSLLEYDKNIIIVIDDIDRLTNNQIRDVFQLVKQVADFPKIIYLLVMDKDVVSRALSEVHNLDGMTYLEKIVQVPFEIPGLDRAKVENIFIDKVNSIITDADITISETYWNHVFQYCIKPYIITLRDINRVINVFQFKYYALKEETYLVDLLALTTIEVLEPDLYKWIRGNKHNLCKTQPPVHYIDEKKLDYMTIYTDEFQNLGLNVDKCIKSVATLFPVFNADVNKFYLNYEYESELRSRKRIAHPEKFDLYFSFDLDSVKVSKTEIDNIMYNYNTNALQKSIGNIISLGNIRYLLDELTSMVEQIPYNRLEVITKTIIEIMGCLETSESNRSEINAAERFVYRSFEKIKTNDERFEILKTSLKNMNIKSLGFFSFIISKQGYAFGRIGHSPQNPENQIISSEQLDILESEFIDKIYNINPPEAMLNILEFPFFLGEWELIDNDGQDKYLSRFMSGKQFMLQFVCNLAHRWYGNGEGGWEFYNERYTKFVSDNEIYNTIQDWGKENLEKFDEEEQIKLATFVLRFDSQDNNNISESEAIKLLDQWNNDSKN